jgi:hypothetical protein
MKGHTRFPGAFVYLNDQSNGPNNVITLTIIVIKLENPTYR